MNRLSMVVTLAVTLAACGDSNRSLNPYSPSVVLPNPTFTVSGTVFGQGGVPLEGVKVQVAGRQGTTDGNGNYTLLEVPPFVRRHGGPEGRLLSRTRNPDGQWRYAIRYPTWAARRDIHAFGCGVGGDTDRTDTAGRCERP